MFDEHYHKQFLDAGLLDQTGGDLQHLISDAATMQIIRWTGGGFGMACHNYDGDMLTDEVAQVRPTASTCCSHISMIALALTLSCSGSDGFGVLDAPESRFHDVESSRQER